MKPKIALIKQEIYQDLYVCPSDEKNVANILFSSQGRVGPIGLMAELGADFYIIKEEYNRETQIYKKVIPHIAKHLHLLKTQTLDKIPGQEFKQPGSTHANGEFAINCNQIDWGTYDIVISINITLPTYLVAQYPNTLFCYMIGEANMASSSAHFGYDLSLNQMARGIVSNKLGSAIDFPYTFLKGNTLQSLMKQVLNRPSLNKGIFMEINSTTERPVTKAPKHFQPLLDIGQTINLHQQNIKNNLQSIYDSKYFVKWGGRTIRGNSVAEAISLGTLAIMNRDEVIHKELIIDECNVKSMQDIVTLILDLEQDKNKYEMLLEKQQKVLTHYFFDCPLESLISCAEEKKAGKYCKYNWLKRITDYFYFIKF